ncbi:MAG TPA: toll/interleukin-1 receptor domain-containing protein [Ktedonobacteraceae bacterium]|nr:toll/interleukin-1 receptor domain-containing protein [Ktedonobacteraceae bacterium]
MVSSSSTRSKVFISYSHKDARYLDQLVEHLAYYERNNLIESWSDKKITPGAQWRAEIKRAIEYTKVAVLLFSPSFLASKFIAENELPPLLHAAEKEGAIILPVIVRPSNFEDTELANFQAVNSPSMPVAKMKGYQRDELWAKVVRDIKKAIIPQQFQNLTFSNQRVVGDELIQTTPELSISDDKQRQERETPPLSGEGTKRADEEAELSTEKQSIEIFTDSKPRLAIPHKSITRSRIQEPPEWLLALDKTTKSNISNMLDKSLVPTSRKRITAFQITEVLRQAETFQTLGRFSDAIDLCEQIIESGFDRQDVRYFLGWLYQEQKRWDDAIRQFQTLLNYSDYALSCYYALGQCYRAKGDLRTATMHFEEAIGRVNLDTLTKQESDQLVQLCQEAVEAHRLLGEQEQALKVYNALLGFLRSRGWNDMVALVEFMLKQVQNTPLPQ